MQEKTSKTNQVYLLLFIIVLTLPGCTIIKELGRGLIGIVAFVTFLMILAVGSPVFNYFIIGKGEPPKSSLYTGLIVLFILFIFLINILTNFDRL
jgi:hypothetical protein